MRRTLLAAAVLLALPAAGRAGDAFSDFRIPDHHEHVYAASLSAYADRSSSNSPGTSAFSRNASPMFGAQARWTRDSEARQWDIGLIGSARGDWASSGGVRVDPGYASYDQSDRSSNALESVRLVSSARTYPFRVPLGITASLSASSLDQQTWDRSSDLRQYVVPTPAQTQLAVGSRETWSYYQQVGAGVGVGWGRVRDASGVHVAEWMERRWMRDHALARPLSDAARAKLAQLFSIRSSYGYVHDRPDKAFWRDVESVLREDGALAHDGLDAWASNHALDALTATSFGSARASGWFVGPQVATEQTHQVVRVDVANSISMSSVASSAYDEFRQGVRQVFSTSSTTVGLVAQVARAFGLRTQLDAIAFAGADVRGLRRYTEASAEIVARCWIDERWALGARTAGSRTITAADAYQPDTWSALAEGGLSYYLEDHWSAGVLASIARSMRDVPSHDSVRQGRIQLGIGWNRGALDAPGLIAPVRPLD